MEQSYFTQLKQWYHQQLKIPLLQVVYGMASSPTYYLQEETWLVLNLNLLQLLFQLKEVLWDSDNIQNNTNENHLLGHRHQGFGTYTHVAHWDKLVKLFAYSVSQRERKQASISSPALLTPGWNVVQHNPELETITELRGKPTQSITQVSLQLKGHATGSSDPPTKPTTGHIASKEPMI